MQRADRVPVRSVARLPDGRLPAAGQALARPLAERLGQEVVEEAAEDELRRVALDRVADAGQRRGGRIETRVDGGLHRLERGEPVGRQEPGDRRPEGDRRRLGAGESVDLVGLEGRDAVEEAGQRLGRIGRPWRGRVTGRPAVAADAPSVVARVAAARRRARDRRSPRSWSYRARSSGSLSQSWATLIRFARSSPDGPATSGWCWRRSERQATSIASGLASTEISRRAYRSSAGSVGRGGTGES